MAVKSFNIFSRISGKLVFNRNKTVLTEVKTLIAGKINNDSVVREVIDNVSPWFSSILVLAS